MATRPPRDRGGAPDGGAGAITADGLAAFNRFPDANPSPVLRIAHDGRLLYANRAAIGVVDGLGIAGDGTLASVELGRLHDAAANGGSMEVHAAGRTFELWPVAFADIDFLNVYGIDVTAERAVARFPDQNPNPVFRIDRDGTLIYANPAVPRAARRARPVRRGAAAGHAPRGAARAGDTRRSDPLRRGVRLRGFFALVAVDVHGFGFVNVYGTDITAERDRAILARENERLLLNILPEPIAARLRGGEPMIADRFEDVTLLFADIAEFTQMSAAMSPGELVQILNDVFTVFDELVDRHGLEKVKTIGDAYMVVGGIPEPTPDHTERIAAMALELAAAVQGIEAARRLGIEFRIGIHRGPVVAGVIGTRKFIYDVWGDTVNVASRMESHGVPGRIQVTGAVHERLEGRYPMEARGLIDVKGKGPTPTWFLLPAAPVTDRSRAVAARPAPHPGLPG